MRRRLSQRVSLCLTFPEIISSLSGAASFCWIFFVRVPSSSSAGLIKGIEYQRC